MIGLPVIHHIPRSTTVQDAEFEAKTVIEAYPDSAQAEEYRILARKILENKNVYIPEPVDLETIKSIMAKYAG